MVGVADFGWACAVGPGQAAGVGGGNLVVTVAGQAVVGRAGEEQLVGVGGAAGGPVRAVVGIRVAAGLTAIRTGAAAVAAVADDALVGGGGAVLAAQVEKPVDLLELSKPFGWISAGQITAVSDPQTAPARRRSSRKRTGVA